MPDAPCMYWVGIDTAADASPDDLARFNDFYSNTHIREVVANNPGFRRAIRYERHEQDARGDFGPRWLAVYEMDSLAAAQGYITRNDGPAEGRPVYTPGPPAWESKTTRWRILWHRLVPEQGSLGPDAAPYVFMVGMNVPPATSAAGLQEFNDFYTRIHVPEVVQAGKFLSGTRFELLRELLHPAPGAPRFLAVYEGDDAAMKLRAERDSSGATPGLSSGPPTWEAHDTLWRLVYRRLDVWERP